VVLPEVVQPAEVMPASYQDVAGDVSAPLIVTPSADVPTSTRQDKKYLRVKNNSAGPMQISLVYLDESGDNQAAWMPAAGPDGINQPLTFNLERGQESLLSLRGTDRLLTSRVRIWAKSGTKSWMKYRDEDLVLVDRPYEAEQPATFPLQFGD
jgi:hypothetical protein